MYGTQHVRRTIQWDRYSCMPACARMALRHFGQDVSMTELRSAMRTQPKPWFSSSAIGGTYVDNAVAALQAYGFNARFQQLQDRGLTLRLAQGNLVIALVDEARHVALVHGIDDQHVWLADPAPRRIGRTYAKADFYGRYSGGGIVLRDR